MTDLAAKSLRMIGNSIALLSTRVADPGISSRQRLVFGLLSSLVFTPPAWLIWHLLDLKEIHLLYMIPVVASAIRYGAISGLGASVTGSLTSAFLFYPPIFSFAVVSPAHLASLTIFVLVAVIAGHLSATASDNAEKVARSYRELEQLYALSRRLSLARVREDIISAIEDHIGSLMGARAIAIMFDPAEPAARRPSGLSPDGDALLAGLLATARTARSRVESRAFTDPGTGNSWIFRPMHRDGLPVGALVIEVPDRHVALGPALSREIDSMLDNGVQIVERLDLAARASEAHMQRQGEVLREAIIGSVSHGLRTPLAAITGSASIMASARAVADDERLAGLVAIILQEASRLNTDIGNLLDAAALSTSGPTPRLALTEPSDLVAAAVDSKRAELAAWHLDVRVAEDLPYVMADPVFARNALGLLIDNALRYSEPGTAVRIVVAPAGENVAIAVEDEGVGIDHAERDRLFEKHYRGTSVRATTRGSGLGLWIASAFAGACGGRIEIGPRHGARGTRAALLLPVCHESHQGMGEANEQPEVRPGH